VRFSDITGHRSLVRLLSGVVARGAVPPTLLFVGPAGVGKWRMARTVAAAVNCLSPVTSTDPDRVVDACGECRTCDRISRDVHVDVLALEPDDKASIKIDAVRDLVSRIGFRPFEGRRRFVLLREADTLEPQAQNALLKSLEEPPPATSFILTTAVPGLLLDTVRSRCMRMAFGRLTVSEVAAVLAARGFDEREARAAAALADGSVGQALSLGSADLGIIRETALLLLQQTAGAGGMAARLQAAAVLVTTPSRKERPREDVGLILHTLASLLRDIEALNGGADRRVLANPALVDDLSRLQRAFDGDRARAAFQAVDRAIYAIQRNAGSKVVAEWLSAQI
jgi:DNA polymerase III subunit delta'